MTAGNLALPARLQGLAGNWTRTRYELTHRALATTLTAPLALWHLLLEPRGALPSGAARRALLARVGSLLERDWRNVEDGWYPRDLLFSQPWTRYARLVPASIPELWRIWRRRSSGRFAELPSEVDLDAYPPYYRRTFHWQTDGWLSRRSARFYDGSVELLFGGTADVLRRMPLAAVVKAVRGTARPRVVDLGCGTGRFLWQLGRTLPAAKLYGVDLSPYYLAHARELLADSQQVSLIAENAEALPFRDGTFDAAVSIFLLHELPKDARRRVLAEALRVLEPGGTLVVCDADQPSTGSELRPVFDRFARLYHEPYFASYLGDDLAQAVRESGFLVREDEAHFVERVVVAQKPS